MARFELLKENRLPNPLVINDKLMTQEDYNQKIREVAKEQVMVASMKSMPICKVLYQTCGNLFYHQHEVIHLFINKPNFPEYMEADEIYRKMINTQLPDEERWEKLNDLL